jgi:hypothetical protein
MPLGTVVWPRQNDALHVPQQGVPMPSKDNNFNWGDELWRRDDGDGGPEQTLNFGDIAVCERCGVTMPANEAQMIPRTIYMEQGGLAEITRTNLVVCPRCLRAVARKNRWLEIRHWILLFGVGALCLVFLMILALYLRRLR